MFNEPQPEISGKLKPKSQTNGGIAPKIKSNKNNQ